MADSNEQQRSRVSRRKVLGVGSAFAAGLVLAACSSSKSASPAASTTTTPASTDPKDIAAAAYTFGYPLVLMDVTRQAAGPANEFAHALGLPTPTEKSVVRLNLDTLYSQAWLDLRAEPLVLQVPGMDGGRYWLMQLMDVWTNTRHNPSSVHPQTGGGAPYTYLVTGPGWSGTVPDGMTRLDMPTGTAWLLGRVQVNGAQDEPAVRALQQRLQLVPLSAWQRGERTAPSRPYTPDPAAVPPPKQVAGMDGTTFFNRMCALMAANPPASEDAPALARFATIGVKPGATVDNSNADALNGAAARAKSGAVGFNLPGSTNENGWSFNTKIGSYGTDYALRAVTAAVGLGANLPEDAIYPSVNGKADDNGTPIRYRLHFPAGQLPPVDAFWSLTVYDADSYLVPNAADIDSVGHLVPVVKNADGSVDLAVQSADPGNSVPQGNWLPIPATGTFSLSMRLYAPQQQALNGDWKPPALTKQG
ncbi:DUF1254 domain-containing protein [Nocardia sp. NPDC020380]|uniref:DUF1254 domain-containing protein n=1 Tax=Nocardia sp. NPDC020380 TaxID=3364309 RepID=UPI0037B3876A